MRLGISNHSASCRTAGGETRYRQGVGCQDPLQSPLVEIEFFLNGRQGYGAHTQIGNVDEECQASGKNLRVSSRLCSLRDMWDSHTIASLMARSSCSARLFLLGRPGDDVSSVILGARRGGEKSVCYKSDHTRYQEFNFRTMSKCSSSSVNGCFSYVVLFIYSSLCCSQE